MKFVNEIKGIFYKVIAFLKIVLSNSKVQYFNNDIDFVKRLSPFFPYKDIIIDKSNIIVENVDLMIIIPAYNVEKYIEECIESVLAQKTRYSFSVCVVEDGSSDETRNILKKYENDKRVSILYKENQGLSAARNDFLKTIVGRYLMFVDSDDRLGENSIDALLDKAYKFDADIVEGNVANFFEDRIIKKSKKVESVSQDDICNDLRTQPWAKVYKSKLWQNVSFPEEYWYEDTIIPYVIFPRSVRNYSVSECVYMYRYNPKGITASSKNSNKSIQTLYLTLFFFNRIISMNEKIKIDMAKQFLDQIRVNCIRIENLCDEVQMEGFLIAYYIVEKMNFYNEFMSRLDYREKRLIKSIRTKKMTQYSIICKNWNYL